MILSDFLSRQRHDDSDQHEKVLFHLICKTCYRLDIITWMRENKGNI